MPRHTVHVNAADLRAGRPGLVLRAGAVAQFGTAFTIHCPSCGVAAATIRQQDNPQLYGARAWVETDGEVAPS